MKSKQKKAIIILIIMLVILGIGIFMVRKDIQEKERICKELGYEGHDSMLTFGDMCYNNNTYITFNKLNISCNLLTPNCQIKYIIS